MEWVIVAVIVFSILIIVVARGLKRQARSDGISTQDVVPSDRYRASAPTRQVPSRLSAKQALSLVQVLRDQNAQWDEILSGLNPTGDPEVQQLVIEIRGPHMFVPHVGLSVIEDGCKRALASSPKADAGCPSRGQAQSGPFRAGLVTLTTALVGERRSAVAAVLSLFRSAVE
jgi:hypothetical protein